MRQTLPARIKAGEAPKPRIRTIVHNNVSIHLYSIGWLSYWSRMAQVTIRLWQRERFLPTPIFDLGDSIRWYTSKEILEFSAAINRHYQSGRNKAVLRKELATINIRLRTDYVNLNESNKTKHPADFFSLPAESKHSLIIAEQQKAKKLEKRRAFYAGLHHTLKKHAINQEDGN